MPMDPMTTAADYIASHAVVTLLAVTLLMIVLTIMLWRAIAYVSGHLLTDAASRSTSASSRFAWVRRLRAAPVFGGALTSAYERTLSVGRYLGWYAITSFVIAIAALAGFLELADEIGVDESMAEFDLALSRALSLHLSDTVLAAAAAITHLGDAPVLVALSVAVALLLFARRQWVLAWAWIATTACGGIMTRLLKAWFARSRPLHEHGFATADGWSFPSGHASGSMLVYGLLGYLLIRHTRSAWHLPIVITTMILAVFVGSSRVLLQVHYLSDVLAGWATAIVWLSLCIAGLEAVRRRSERE